MTLLPEAALAIQAEINARARRRRLARDALVVEVVQVGADSCCSLRHRTRGPRLTFALSSIQCQTSLCSQSFMMIFYRK